MVIPEKSDQIARRSMKGSRGGRPPRFGSEFYRDRNVVERAFNRLKAGEASRPAATSTHATTAPAS